jgi:hemolysin activation/secretion protein
MQAGGAFTVRGSKEGRTIGDSGVVLSAEWRIPAYFLPADKNVPFSKNLSWRDAITFLVFTDAGATFTNDVSVGTDANEYLLSVGAGVRLQLNKRLSARLDLGIPLAHDGEKINGARLHFGLDGLLF